MLYHDDCFNVFPQLEDNSIDLVLCDMPYGTTACKWDTVIDLERMWVELKRVCRPNTAIVFTACQPFTSALVMSNPAWFKVDWIWEKEKGTGHLQAKFMPMKNKEDILIFGRGKTVYNPQFTFSTPYDKGVRKDRYENWVYGKVKSNHERAANPTGRRYPKQILKIKSFDKTKQHPTQKPVALMEYLIKTYSNEGDTVLDFCMGSGTTGVACKNLNREFIGIEKEREYFDIAQERINADPRP